MENGPVGGGLAGVAVWQLFWMHTCNHRPPTSICFDYGNWRLAIGVVFGVITRTSIRRHHLLIMLLVAAYHQWIISKSNSRLVGSKYAEGTGYGMTLTSATITRRI